MASTRDWFETVAEAQRRAKRQLPRAVYQALVAGTEAGFKTKMDLLLAVIRDDRVTALDDLLPPLDPGTDLREAVADLWRRLSSVLGEPSTARKIMIQELDSHPEIRQRALELHDRIVASVSAYLAEASQAGSAFPGRGAQPGPEHVAAARLLTITAGMAPLLGEPSLTLVPPDALAVLISDGLRHRT